MQLLPVSQWLGAGGGGGGVIGDIAKVQMRWSREKGKKGGSEKKSR